MPALRDFVVTQTREVRVSATTIIDAVLLANRAFSQTKRSQDEVNVRSGIIEIELTVREES